MCSVENGCAVTSSSGTSVRGVASSQSDLAQPSRPVNELLLLGLLRRLPLLLPPWVPFVCCRSRTAPLLPDLLAMLQAAAEQRAATGGAAEAWWSQCTDPATPKRSRLSIRPTPCWHLHSEPGHMDEAHLCCEVACEALQAHERSAILGKRALTCTGRLSPHATGEVPIHCRRRRQQGLRPRGSISAIDQRYRLCCSTIDSMLSDTKCCVIGSLAGRPRGIPSR